MPKGYWIVHITINDPENYPKYIAAGAEAFKTVNAKFLVKGGKYETLEGSSRERHVIIEFESYDQAVKYYHSPEYQAAAKLRQAYADSEVVIVEGVE